MLDFVKFFVNLFLHLNISFDSKKIASEDCLGKIAFQNTDGQFDDMLAATQAVHDDLFQDVSDIDTSVAVQKALTEITDELMDKFTKRVTKLNLHFESTGFVDSPYYNEFFLHGVQEITKGTNKGNIVTYMNRMINAITAHTTEAGGPSVLTEFQNFKTQYNNARQAQELKKGGTQGKRTTRNEAEVAWAEQMFDNLLTIAKLYKGKPEKVNDFFTQHLFERHYSSDKDHIGTLTGKVTHGHTIVAEPDVRVHVVDGKINDAFTKADGIFRTQRLPVGFWKVQFSKPGFITQEVTIEIFDDGDTTFDVSMEMEVAPS